MISVSGVNHGLLPIENEIEPRSKVTKGNERQVSDKRWTGCGQVAQGGVNRQQAAQRPHCGPPQALLGNEYKLHPGDDHWVQGGSSNPRRP